MDAHSFSSRVEVLSVTDSGRRRRWSLEEKTRIVEESLSRPRAVAATARRHQIARALLTPPEPTSALNRAFARRCQLVGGK